jgi:prophage tail gpP-like protein
MITLKISGRQYGGWESATIERGINAIASSFSAAVSGKRAHGIDDIAMNEPVQAYDGNTLVLTGYVENIDPSYDAATHNITISGRSKTCDLVDCSVLMDGGQINSGDVQSIVRQIIRPFGIGLVFNAAGAFPVDNFQLQTGETAGSVIERLCAMHKLVFYDNPAGQLVIGSAVENTASGALVHKIADGSKNNILSCQASYSNTDRFSKYIVRTATAGNDEFADEESTAIEGSSDDRDVPRYRPIILLPESQIGNSTANDRAVWEKATRIGKSKTFVFKVQGWRNARKELWQPNSWVLVDDDEINLNGRLIISKVALSISGAGTLATLSVAPPEAFIPSILQNKVKSYQGWKELKYGV